MKKITKLNIDLAKVGIIALVDEATGYQKIRDKDALAKILEENIDKEAQPWTKTFPIEFYEEIYKLKKRIPDKVINKFLGKDINSIVYSRLDPDILQELQRINPDVGHPKLKEYLAVVTAIMRMSPNWKIFMRNLERAFPTTKPI